MRVPIRNLERRAEVHWGSLSVLLLALLLHACGTPSACGDDYVLLRNGNVIQGTVVPVGHEMLIRRPGGSELKLDARQVVFAANSLAELYEFRVGSRQISDASSHHDDARWCFRNGLYAQMRQSLEAAEAFTPGHPETLRLQRQLQAATEPATDSASLVPMAQSALSEPIMPETRDALPQHSDEDLSGLNVSSESLAFFTSRVQPILINRCGNTGCHRSPTEAAWDLTHLGVQSRPPARMTRLNLVATLKLANIEEPQESDLLRYAVHPHGGRREPPLRRTDEVALDSLRHWTQLIAQTSSSDAHTPLPADSDPGVYTAGNSGRAAMAPSRVVTAGWEASLDRLAVHPADFVTGSGGVAASEALPPAWPQPAGPGAAAGPSSARGQDAALDGTAAGVATAVGPGAATSRTGRPTRLPAVNNPFDPAVFNRHYRR